MFSDSVAGVKASANLYSLIETAKANGLEPYAYLRQVYTKLPAADTVEAMDGSDLEDIRAATESYLNRASAGTNKSKSLAPRGLATPAHRSLYDFARLLQPPTTLLH